MIILITFLILLYIFYKRKSTIVVFLLSIQILSLIGYHLLEREEHVDIASTMLIDIFTVCILLLVITPWYSYSNITRIIPFSDKKTKSLTTLFIVLSVPPFFIFSYMAIQLYSQGFDINSFKYAPDVGRDFRHSLPINRFVFGASLLLTNIGYFLIPLHFHFWNKGKKTLSLSLFFLSMNPVIYGLTYFSRAAIIQYAFIYIFFIILLYHTFSDSKKRSVRNFSFISLILGSLYFLKITFSRFEDHYFYDGKIPESSLFYGNTPLYSLVDYLSQWYYNNLELLNNYQFETFGGAITLHTISSILNELKIITYDYNEIFTLRRTLWPDHSVSFNGLIAYSTYDYGYILTLVFSIIYFYYLYKMRPKKINQEKSITFNQLFMISILAQLPLYAIFYSSVGAIIVPLLFLIIFKVYSKISLRSKY